MNYIDHMIHMNFIEEMENEKYENRYMIKDDINCQIIWDSKSGASLQDIIVNELQEHGVDELKYDFRYMDVLEAVELLNCECGEYTLINY